MDCQSIKYKRIAKDQLPLIAANVGDAVALLYRTVKERKAREFVKNIREEDLQINKQRRLQDTVTEDISANCTEPINIRNPEQSKISWVYL